MEVGYLLLACIEIILTVYVCCMLNCATKKVNNLTFELNNLLKDFCFAYIKAAKILKTTSKIAIIYKKFLQTKKEYKHLFKAIKTITGALKAYNIFTGIKTRKFGIFKLIRKLVFYF